MLFCRMFIDVEARQKVQSQRTFCVLHIVSAHEYIKLRCTLIPVTWRTCCIECVCYASLSECIHLQRNRNCVRAEEYILYIQGAVSANMRTSEI